MINTSNPTNIQEQSTETHSHMVETICQIPSCQASPVLTSSFPTCSIPQISAIQTGLHVPQPTGNLHRTTTMNAPPTTFASVLSSEPREPSTVHFAAPVQQPVDQLVAQQVYEIASRIQLQSLDPQP